MPAVLDRGADPDGEHRRAGDAEAEDPDSAGDRRMPEHEIRFPADPGEAGGRYYPAGHLPGGRDHGTEEDRGDGGGALRGGGAAQSDGSAGDDGERAFRGIDAEFSNPRISPGR